MMMMLGKELLSGLWVCPECRSYYCHFSHRSCLTSCFTFYSFFTTLVATRRCRCLLRSARVNVMPERLLSVISGILAGGIPGFRIELCCFYHPLTWPLCVIPCFLCFASCSVAILIMTHKMSSCMLFPLLVAIPLLCVFVLFWFSCGCVFLVCLVSLVSGCGFLVSCWDSSLDCVQVHYQYFCGYRQVDSLAW